MSKQAAAAALMAFVVMGTAGGVSAQLLHESGPAAQETRLQQLSPVSAHPVVATLCRLPQSAFCLWEQPISVAATLVRELKANDLEGT